MGTLDTAYLQLLRKFPALYELRVWHRGTLIFEQTNSNAHEQTASVIVRNLVRLWAKVHSAPSDTFRHRMAERFNIRSATKSIVALLVGIALRDSLISSLEVTLGDLLPEKLVSGLERVKREISLHQLLTMTSGLASMETGVSAMRLFAAPDWTRFMLRLPLVSQPGTRFLYNSANPHLVSAILSHRSGESLAAYAGRHLFEPLGIGHVHWGAGPEGTSFGGGNLFLSAEELGRIGQLCLCRGAWQGRQIIPERWLDQIWKPYEEYFPGWNYGYYWYLHAETGPRTGHSYMTCSAAGAGGQKLLVIPELDLILSAVATTDFVGERGIALNQFISHPLMEAVEAIA